MIKSTRRIILEAVFYAVLGLSIGLTIGHFGKEINMHYTVSTAVLVSDLKADDSQVLGCVEIAGHTRTGRMIWYDNDYLWVITTNESGEKCYSVPDFIKTFKHSTWQIDVKRKDLQ
jgi:hypothetical protein